MVPNAPAEHSRILIFVTSPAELFRCKILVLVLYDSKLRQPASRRADVTTNSSDGEDDRFGVARNDEEKPGLFRTSPSCSSVTVLSAALTMSEK